MWKCQECGSRTKQCYDRCPTCGGSDVDLEVSSDAAFNTRQLIKTDRPTRIEIINPQTYKRYLWIEVDTGGGCTALELQRDGGQSWLITAADDPTTPEDLYKDECILGGYTPDGVNQVAAFRFPSAVAAATSYARMTMKRDCLEEVLYE